MLAKKKEDAKGPTAFDLAATASYQPRVWGPDGGWGTVHSGEEPGVLRWTTGHDGDI